MNNNRGKEDCPPEIKQEDTTGDDCEVDTVVNHIQMVASLIEGRNVLLDEIYRMLDKVLRQHSIDFPGKPLYGDLGFQKIPP